MSAQQIDEVIATNETKLGESGVTFPPDIYERDGKLAAALKAPYELHALLKMKKPA